MDATLILIDNEAERGRARALVERLWNSRDPADMARLEAQARLIAAYEERKWPRRPSKIADLIGHLMDQHDLTRADMAPILGTASRVSEILGGKKGLSLAMIQRLRARFRVPADLLLPPPTKPSVRRARDVARVGGRRMTRNGIRPHHGRPRSRPLPGAFAAMTSCGVRARYEKMCESDRESEAT